MNEWDLQTLLSRHWRKNDLKLNADSFKLICWELMFPSWLINDNKSKWNEISIDFIFYSEDLQTFICLELKNKINNKIHLLTAYCQTVQRSVNFINQYSAQKMNAAMIKCFSDSSIERGGATNKKMMDFSNNPKIKMMLLAYDVPKDAYETICELNKMEFKEIIKLIEIYSENREFKRFKDLKEMDFELVNAQGVHLKEINSLVRINI